MKEATGASVSDRQRISQPFRPRARVLQLLGDDRLSLDLRRVNAPTRRISRHP